MSSDESFDDRNESKLAGGADSPDRSVSDRSRDDLVVELERLRERNQRLQETYARAKQSQYQRTALGLAALGILAIGSAALIPDLRTILLTLGAIGLFGGLLTFYLTPERFVAEDVGRGVYQAMARDRAELVAELGLTDERVYLPASGAGNRTRLFIPQYEDYVVPDEDELDYSLVVPDDEGARGATFTPTGEPLYDSFHEALSGEPAERPEALVAQLTDTLIEQFELAREATVDRDSDANRLTIGVSDTVYGPADQFDNPVTSFFAVGLARGLDQPVTVDVDVVDEGRADYLLTYRWDSEDDTASASP